MLGRASLYPQEHSSGRTPWPWGTQAPPCLSLETGGLETKGSPRRAELVKINWNSLKITQQQHVQKRREAKRDMGAAPSTGQCPGCPGQGTN